MLVLLAEWWWVAPAGASAGTIGVLGARRLGPAGRRLELDAARHDVRGAQRSLARARAELQRVRAELARAKAEGGAAAIAEARRLVRHSERAAKAAVADLAARRASVAAARAALPPLSAPVEAMPLARLRAEHDAVTARWLAYETDPGTALDAPGMQDAASPTLRAFLEAQGRALELRPASADARLSAAGFAAYRDAVAGATAAFEVAERAAVGGPAALPRAAEPGSWGAIADELLGTAQAAIARSLDAWQRDRRERPQA